MSYADPLPCTGQTREEIEAWIRKNEAIGLEVVIRSCYGGFYTYKQASIERIGKNGQLTLSQGGSFGSGGANFYRSGTNCFHPHGQTKLVIPTEATLAACKLTRETQYSGIPV
tara:strand:- start:258 stop:596 length:339 start_codon:yes stop_codon:yes gene_type:complete